jgi:hypothetical protein
MNSRNESFSWKDSDDDGYQQTRAYSNQITNNRESLGDNQNTYYINRDSLDDSNSLQSVVKDKEGNKTISENSHFPNENGEIKVYFMRW